MISTTLSNPSMRWPIESFVFSGILPKTSAAVFTSYFSPGFGPGKEALDKIVFIVVREMAHAAVIVEPNMIELDFLEAVLARFSASCSFCCMSLSGTGYF